MLEFPLVLLIAGIGADSSWVEKKALRDKNTHYRFVFFITLKGL